MKNETLINNVKEMLETAKRNAEFSKTRIAELTMDINFAQDENDIFTRNYHIQQLAKMLNRIEILEKELDLSDIKIIDISANSQPCLAR